MFSVLSVELPAEELVRAIPSSGQFLFSLHRHDSGTTDYAFILTSGR